MYVYLAIALIAAVMSGAGTWKVQNWRFAAHEKERIEAEAEQRRIEIKAIDAAAEAHEKDKAQIRTVTRYITQEVDRVIREPFYVDGACLDADGLRVVGAAVAGQPASEPARAVPGPRPSH